MNITEAHNIGKVLQGQPDRDVMIKMLAKKIRADAEFTPIQKISWSELKNRKNQVVVVKGDQGSSVIYWDGSNYVVYNGSEGETENLDNGTDVLNLVKPAVGKIRALWMAQEVSPAEIRAVRSRRQGGGDIQMTRNRLVETLLNYAPRYLQAAIANLSGMAQQMIKAENYTGAQQKLSRMASLKDLLIKLDRVEGLAMPTEMKNFMQTALDSAIMHTYAYEHPGQVQLRRGYQGTQMAAVDDRQFYDWMIQTLQRRDKTFATILSFLKQEFLTGKISS